MMRLFLFGILSLGLSNLYGQDLSGAWSGKIGGYLPVIFHFQKAADGTLQASFDVPSQQAMGVPLSEVTVTRDSVIGLLHTPAVRVSLAWTNDSTLSGFWEQGVPVPLLIHRGLGSAPMAIKPQTPVPPYPYNSDSVEYDNADRSVHLAGTLTYPKTGGPFPVAVLITGSGQQDRDETILGHKPFAVIADYLTRRGYAILRVDDRMMGLSRGDLAHATSADFAKDVETSVAYLKTRKEINPAKIGLIGHSEGAMIAPMVAAKDKNIAFIILLASPAVGGYQTLLWQTVEPFRRSGAQPGFIAGVSGLEKLVLDNVLAAKDEQDFVQRISAAYKTWYESTPDSIRGLYPSLYFPVDQAGPYFGKSASTLMSPWYRFFLSYPTIDDFRRLQCAVLALDGEQDAQVACDPNLDLIRRTLSEAGNKHFETRAIPGLNHLFQHCHTCIASEYGQLTETFSPEALGIMGDWLDANVGH